MGARVRIVLIDPSHPGNVGSVARAMKNMGLDDLVLVRPRAFPHPEANALAAGADDVLETARVVSSVAEAIADCGFVAGTTSRPRSYYWEFATPRDVAARVVALPADERSALLFGSERFGLANEDLQHCNVLVRIPANPEYCSLNLAMSVQLLSYELYLARERPESAIHLEQALATSGDMEHFYAHLASVLEEIDFADRTGHLMERLRRLFNRAVLDRNELNILRGILSAVQGRPGRSGPGRSRPGRSRPGLSRPGRPVGARPSYFDYAATTPVDARVAARMAECLTREGTFGNPGSRSHAEGERAYEAVEAARREVAAAVGAAAADVVWTSGATEANNLAIFGVALQARPRGRHIITCKTEHKAVLDPCRELERRGWSVTYLVPDLGGRLDPAQLSAALRPDTVLVSLMHVNNEIGVIQDIAGLAALVARHGGARMHVDAAQSVGKCPIDFAGSGIDLMSLSAHKAYGPKGAGALLVSAERGVELEPLQYGGGQERSMRSGTVATHQVVGMGAAIALAAADAAPGSAESLRIAVLRERLWDGLRALGGTLRNGEPTICVPHLLNVSFADVEGESLLAAVQDELALSTGSACTSSLGEPSYVLRALGRDDRLAEASLRLSLGRFSTTADVDHAIAVISHAVLRLRSIGGVCATTN
jgi:cysteine desulfurase